MKSNLIIHIENDVLIRYTWVQQAKKFGLKILSYENYESAKEELIGISKSVSFYVDQDLGDGKQKGVDVLLDLYRLGYRNLYLSTGHSKEEFEEYSLQFTVRGKDFPDF